jgi:sec-independent protein translocase protein TatB
MFDLDAGKLLVFGIVALAVIPPKDLPRVLRTVGQYVGKMRRMASEFQGQFMDAMREAERAADLESMKKEIKSLDESAKIDASFDLDAAMRGDSAPAIESPRPTEPVTPVEPPMPAEPAKPVESSQPVAAAEPAHPSREPFFADLTVKPPAIPEGPPASAEAREPSAAP